MFQFLRYPVCLEGLKCSEVCLTSKVENTRLHGFLNSINYKNLDVHGYNVVRLQLSNDVIIFENVSLINGHSLEIAIHCIL